MALLALQKEAHFPKDHRVLCNVRTGEDAAEVSLAENVVRQAIHPADEFEAFNALATAKPPMSTAKIAERFGKTEKHVLQRLKLAYVAPQLLKEYRLGKINLECLEAFTITDDQKRQMQVHRIDGDLLCGLPKTGGFLGGWVLGLLGWHWDHLNGAGTSRSLNALHLRPRNPPSSCLGLPIL
jgi:hypothetical protein